MIEDFVEIGANCCVDRAKFGDTVIGAGTKIDNLVQIAHNVVIGRCCLIAGQAGMGGSVRIEDGAVLAGSAGVSDHITVGRQALIGARGLAISDVEAGQKVLGFPAIDQKTFWQIYRAVDAAAADDAATGGTQGAGGSAGSRGETENGSFVEDWFCEGKALKLQKTINGECKLSGKGLFSGAEVKMIFRPAEPNTGIVFVRTDLPEPVRIPALADNIVERDRRTALQNGAVCIETPEHCMAAISALGISNLVIEMDAQELPGFDGSSEEFFQALEKCGLVEQQAEQRELAITEEISITDGDKAIYALPNNAPGLTITYELDYTEHTGIGRQLFSCEFSQEQFAEQLATARTFVLEAEARFMQSRGIGTHLTPKDILVISSDGPIKNSYRFENECVRHKVADLIGDLALVGRPLSGRIVAYKSGHLQNQRLARKLVQMAQRLDRKGGSSTTALMDIRRIQKILPHRYPFLLVDKIVEIDGDRRIKGVKNVTFNETVFPGPLSRHADHAGGADHRGAGAGVGTFVRAAAGAYGQAGGAADDGRGEDPQVGGAGRSAHLDLGGRTGAEPGGAVPVHGDGRGRDRGRGQTEVHAGGRRDGVTGN